MKKQIEKIVLSGFVPQRYEDADRSEDMTEGGNRRQAYKQPLDNRGAAVVWQG